MDTIEEVQLRWNSGGVDQRSPLLGSEPAEVAALQTPGELAEEQRLLQELHLALDRELGSLGSWWNTGRRARHHPVWGRGQAIPVQIV